VILSAPDNYVPAFDAMALLATCSHLATMYIGMAVGAIPARIGKDPLSVTLVAGDAFVPAQQRVIGLVVVELRCRPDWLPTDGCMTILTSNVQIAVWASRDAWFASLPKPLNNRDSQQKRCDDG
jgi:hypothetical protein